MSKGKGRNKGRKLLAIEDKEKEDEKKHLRRTSGKLCFPKPKGLRTKLLP